MQNFEGPCQITSPVEVGQVRHKAELCRTLSACYSSEVGGLSSTRIQGYEDTRTRQTDHLCGVKNPVVNLGKPCQDGDRDRESLSSF